MQASHLATRFFALCAFVIISLSFKNFDDQKEFKFQFYQSSTLTTKKVKSETPQPHSVNSTINILFYTPFWADTFWLKNNEAGIQNASELQNCNKKNCRFTTQKKLLPNIESFDALIFHHAQGWNVDGSLWKIPKNRSLEQYYIFAADEPPSKTGEYSGVERNFYNLTMSYKLDSDIGWYYGVIKDLSTNKTVAPALNVQWKDPEKDFNGYDEETLQLSKSKNKTAVWYYSVLGVASNRFTLGSNLKNYIDIDMYGKDQKLKCKPYPARCVENAGKIYKFYLAFENDLCEDYFTEKAFRAIEENLVPVIYSGAKISNFLPPKSYIDANSFETVEHLGKYLKFLSENEEEYLKYFWWKKHYKIRQRWLDFCEICEALNDMKSKDVRKSVESVNKFYFLNKCSKPKISF